MDPVGRSFPILPLRVTGILRTLLCAGIVIDHSTTFLNPGLRNSWPAGILTAPLLMTAIVPVFFYLSGYYAGGPSGTLTQAGGRNFLQKKVQRLIIPFLIWGVLTTALQIGLSQPPTWSDLVGIIIGSNQFYFIFVLIQLALLYRFLVRPRISESNTGAFLALSATIALLNSATVDVLQWTVGPAPAQRFANWGAHSLIAWGVFYMLGAWANLHPAFLETLTRRARLIGCAWIVSYAAYVAELKLSEDRFGWSPVYLFVLTGFVFMGMTVLAGSVLMLRARGGIHRIPLHSLLWRWSTDTYGIYLAHVFVLLLVIRFYHRLTDALLPFAVEAPVFCLVTWLLTLGLVRLVRRSGGSWGRRLLLGEWKARKG
jgi:fucose 4-O-acetylase-like acetyltransferase